MRPALLALLIVLAAGAPLEPQPAHPLLPWLFNMQDVVAVGASDRAATGPVDEQADAEPGCPADAYPALELTAELAPSAGRELVRASYAQGVRVLGSEGQLLASTPGYPCEGSADDLEVLGVGRGFDAPMVVLALTTGGRREQLTWLGLFRMGLAGRLEPVFAGVVEERADGDVRRGRVMILPGALLHRAPDGATALWVFDEAGGVYTPRGTLGDSEIPHV